MDGQIRDAILESRLYVDRSQGKIIAAEFLTATGISHKLEEIIRNAD